MFTLVLDLGKNNWKKKKNRFTAVIYCIYPIAFKTVTDSDQISSDRTISLLTYSYTKNSSPSFEYLRWYLWFEYNMHYKGPHGFSPWFFTVNDVSSIRNIWAFLLKNSVSARAATFVHGWIFFFSFLVVQITIYQWEF